MADLQTKLCTKCNEEKDVWDFSFRNKGNRTRRTDCKACQRKTVRKHYNSNKEQYKRNNKKQRERIKKIIHDLKKDKPCVDCNGLFDPCQLDFDHIDRSNKVANVSLLFGSMHVKKALEEVKKCELVCANCHRLRTRDRDEYNYKKDYI